ncbi:MAG: hypothetical protein JST54_11560 [Deltaproteobacteria bacterium]|nr:hypothetical protein [Deltaproteobacteria bacterium]
MVPVEPELVVLAPLLPAELVPSLLLALDDDPVPLLALDDALVPVPLLALVDAEDEAEVEVVDDSVPVVEPFALELELPAAPAVDVVEAVDEVSLPPQPLSRPETSRATETASDLERCMRAPPVL